jgi:hypothetical protein
MIIVHYGYVEQTIEAEPRVYQLQSEYNDDGGDDDKEQRVRLD